MTFFCNDVSGLIIRVHDTAAGWEASVASSPTITDRETAQAVAQRFAESITGKPESLAWQEGTENNPGVVIGEFRKQ